MILDIGPVTAREWSSTIEESGTIIWNGPMGVFEFDQFGEGTREIAEAIARSSAYSLAGGGDTIAAVDKYEVSDNVSYISTGGGAFMEYLEGKKNCLGLISFKPRTFEESKLALISMRQLLDHAAENDYGVPAFNVNNLEQMRAIMEGARNQ